MTAPAGRVRAALDRGERLDERVIDDARRFALGNPRRAFLLSLAGWLPVALLLPPLVAWIGGPEGIEVAGHFLTAFVLAALLGTPGCVLAMDYLTLRTVYPYLWGDARGLADTVRRELKGVGRRLFIGQFLTGMAPLAAAVLLIIVGPDEFIAGHFWAFRTLLAALIVLGLGGFWLAQAVGGVLNHPLDAMSDHNPKGDH